MEVIPSIYEVREVGSQSTQASAFSNFALRPGEVVGVVHPRNPRSRSKKFFEYEVYVAHRENGTAVTQIYRSVILADMFGGRADHLRYLLRADATEQVNGRPHAGSKVLILCVNGAQSDAVIIGGHRDDKGSDAEVPETELARLDFEYNGVAFSIADDGALSLTVKGPTAADGTLRQGAEENGATVTVDASGTITAATADQSVVMTKDGDISVAAKGKVLVDSQDIKLGGDDVSDQALLGTSFINGLQQFNQDMQQALIQLQGGAIPPYTATLAPGFISFTTAVTTFTAKLQTFLAQTTKVG